MGEICVRMNHGIDEKKGSLQVGRMAGQFAKPRSSDVEDVNGIQLPSYRGDNINGDGPTLDSRQPNPERMVRAYSQAAATLNLLRAFATGGYAAMQRVTHWNLDFASHSEQGDRYVIPRKPCFSDIVPVCCEYAWWLPLSMFFFSGSDLSELSTATASIFAWLFCMWLESN